MKKRIDLILVEKNIVESRTSAQNLIKSGKISIEGNIIKKNNLIFDSDIDIKVDNSNINWVSRGAIKLLHAFDYFKINVDNFICLDIGASTGGFTEVLLSKKVKKIYSVDVGTDQLHKKLISSCKVVNIQKTNARYLNKKIITDPINIIVCDVSFISMKKVLEPSLCFLEKSGYVIGLIKPQFESEKKNIEKKGIITNAKIHKKICDDFNDWFISKCKMNVLGITPSPIMGPKGNKEFLICVKKN